MMDDQRNTEMPSTEAVAPATELSAAAPEVLQPEVQPEQTADVPAVEAAFAEVPEPGEEMEAAPAPAGLDVEDVLLMQSEIIAAMGERLAELVACNSALGDRVAKLEQRVKHL